KALPEDRPELIDVNNEVPSGPVISESGGEKAQNRTYQDLLKTPNDERNFEILTHSEIKKVSLDGDIQDFLPKAMYKNLRFSPDGKYVLVSSIQRPFSYLVPYSRFPSREVIYTAKGKKLATVNETPLIEVLPQGFMATQEGKRNLAWRSDLPATLYWVEALDKGDPEMDVPYRDAVYELQVTVTGAHSLLVKTKNRYAGIIWGDTEHAVVMDRWFSSRNTKTYVFNPSDNHQEPYVLFDRNYQDLYSDPGRFVTQKNKYGLHVLELQKNKIFLSGDGYTPNGQFPYIAEVNLTNANTRKLYESEYTDKLEDITRVLDIEKGDVLVRIESKNEFPNYYIR